MEGPPGTEVSLPSDRGNELTVWQCWPRSSTPLFPSSVAWCFYRTSQSTSIDTVPFDLLKTPVGQAKLCISFLELVIMNDHKLGVLKQQKFSLSQFWRPAVQNQGVGRVGSFWRLRQYPSHAFVLAPGSCWHPPAIPRLIHLSLQSLPQPSRGLSGFLLCVSFSVSYRTTTIGFRAHLMILRSLP